MANKRPFSRQLKLLIIVILLFEFPNSLHADGLFSSFQQSIQRRLFKPTSLVKGFFKSFKPFQELPPSPPLTQEDYLMQQAFNSPTGGLLPLGSNNNNNLPISEYLVSNFDRLNPNPSTQGNNNFKKDQMSLSESIPRSSNIFYPNNLMTSSSINHNLMYDQSQKTQSDLDDYPSPSQTVNYREPKEKSGPSISIGSAPGGGLGLKLGKFQMTFRRGNDGPQINLGTHEESSDQEAENSYISMTRAKDKKKGMNIKLGKALQFSIGGNQDEDKIKGSSSNRNAINLKDNFLNRKSNQNNNLMSSASENNYEESPGIQLPAISIGGGGNGGRPAITIGGGESDDENGNSYARPQITIGGGDPDQPQNNNNYNNNINNNNNNNNYNSGPPPQQSGNNGWNDHWERPRIRLKMPDMPQTYIEKNLKLPPIKLKINAAPRVKITTGTKDPLEKKPIEEDPDMEDIFRPPEPFNTTTPGKDKNETNTDMNDGMNGKNGFNNGMFGHKLDPNFNPNQFNDPNQYSDPNYQQYSIQQQNNYPEQINFVSKQQFDEQQSYENNHNKYYSYNHQTDQQTNYQYENTVGETKSSRSNYNNNSNNRRPKNENLQREPSNDAPVYNDQGYSRQPPSNYNSYHVDNNRYPIKQNNNNYNQMNHNYPPPPQLPNHYNQPPAPFNGGPYNNQQSHQQPPNYNRGNSQYQNNNNNYNNNNYNNHHGPYGGKTKEQIEEENSIYIKSKDEYAEDRPQIIMHMRPKISINHVNATHPEEKKDPRHKNPFLKMIMEPEFVNHTTAAPEFDDDFNAPGYNKHYLNHYDYNKYKGHKPGKFGINYVKRTTTPRPLVDKTNRKSLTTTESPIKSDADDSDYYDETTTVMTTTTTTTNSPTKESEEDEEASTKSTGSTTKDPDDELENPTTASDKTTESSSSKSTTASSDDDDDDDDTTKKLTTTSKPGQTTSTTTTTTDNPLNKKLTTSKPAKKATTSTTLSPEDYEDYDFGFLTKCGGKEIVLPDGSKKCRRRKVNTTTKSPSTSLDDDDDSTTESSTRKSNDGEDSNEKIVAPKKKEEDFFTKMMNKIRSEKNGSSDKEEETTTKKATTTTESPSTTTDSDDDDDDVEPTLSTTTSKSKIRGRSQTDRSEALIVTEQPTSLAPKRNLVGSARKAANKLENNKSGINFSNNDEKEDKTDKSMLIHLIRMVNDTMEEVRQHMLLSKEHTTPCPIDNNPKTSTITSASENESTTTTATSTTTEENSNEKENEDNDDNDDKKNSTTDQSTISEKSSTSITTTATSTESSSTITSKNEDEDEDKSEENSEESSTVVNEKSKASKKDEFNPTTIKPIKETETTKLEQTSEKSNEKDNDDDDDDDSEKDSTIKLTSSSTEKTTTVAMNKLIEKSDKRRIISTKKVNSNGVKSKSTFEMNEEKLVSISSTESSVLFSSSSKMDSSSSTSSITKSIDGNKSTKDENTILNDTSLDSKSLPSSNQLDDPELIDQQKESNEPIIVVLLPNEDSSYNNSN